MLISRGLNRLCALKKLSKHPHKIIVARASHTWNYRTAPPPPSKNILLVANVVQGTTWWWVLWHLWTQFDHITGEFEYPDPAKWTDEELGIPPV